MRLVLAMVLAALAALPLSVCAQDAEEGTTAEPNAAEPAPSSEPAPEEPALQLKLDDAGVDVAPSPARTADGYTLEEMELRVERAGVGLIVSAVVLVAGAALVPAAVAQTADCVSFTEPCNESFAVEIVGGVLFVGGLAGTITCGIKLRRRKRDRDSLRAAHYGRPRRVQWDVARSALVF